MTLQLHISEDGSVRSQSYMTDWYVKKVSPICINDTKADGLEYQTKLLDNIYNSKIK